jgi:hypothetical protein
MGTLISLVAGTVLCGAVGAWIGHRRGRRTEGLVLGLLLGPLGWLWVGMAPSRKAPPASPPGQPAQPRLPRRPAMLERPAASRRRAAAIPTRSCPGCVREIPAAAVKCRHCGASIDSAAAPP